MKKFKFSEKKRLKPILEGTKLAYSAGQIAKYKKKLQALVTRMTDETNRKVLSLFNSGTAEEYYEQQEQAAAMDASIASSARILMNKLTRKFEKLFADAAKPLAENMVKGNAKASKDSLNRSLKELSGGVTINANIIPAGMKEVAKAAIAENISLIKSIPSDYMKQINGAVTRAIVSGGDLKLLTKELKKYDGMTERRAKNIAIDQVRKTYNAINKQRMQTVGIKQFMWLHSGGGQNPREDHIEMDGNIYSFDDLPVIDKKTGERGVPGQAINCFSGDTQISLGNGCRNLWRYRHDGEIVDISLESGGIISATLNHPILTLRGWLSADEIQEGDYLIGCEIDDNGVIDVEKTDMKITFEDFFNSFDIDRINANSFTSEFNFHGDIPKANVDSIISDNFLPNGRISFTEEEIESFVLSLSDIFRNNIVFSPYPEVFKPGRSGGARKFFAFFNGEPGHSNFAGNTPVSEDDAILFQNAQNHLSANAERFRECKDAFTFLISINNDGTIRIDKFSLFSCGQNIIESFFKSGANPMTADFVRFAKKSQTNSAVKTLHRVSKKSIRIFSGHVYTMETFNGWYSVSPVKIISKNCRCTMKPIYEFDEEELENEEDSSEEK